MNEQMWGGRFSKPPSSETAAFTHSLSFDIQMWAEDIEVTRAHAHALERAEILTQDETQEISAALDQAAGEFEEGTISFEPTDEDIHTVVERYLTEKLGATGAKIHAGRSRNDLVVTDLRLWLKRRIPRVARGIHEVQEALYRLAREHEDVLAPGYTHLQRAQPVLLPHILLAHGFALARDFERTIAAYRHTDVSTLGAAAFAGTSLATDAPATAIDLGFARVFDNAADAVSDRDFALEFMAAAAILGVHLSRLGEDIVIWTTSEFGFASLDDSFATGSSIMPQKKNPDIAELARAKSARLTADLVHLLGAMKGLPLTYNRDLQEDKEPLFDSVGTTLLVLGTMKGMLNTMKFDTQRLLEAAEGGASSATDIAESLVRKGVAFRDAHHAVGRLVALAAEQGVDIGEVTLSDAQLIHPSIYEEMLGKLDARSSVERRDSHGGTSPRRIAEQFARYEALVDDEERWLAGFGAY
ncbi:MAG: argininosuccinate lyase [Actinomycetota bacterium]